MEKRRSADAHDAWDSSWSRFRVKPAERGRDVPILGARTRPAAPKLRSAPGGMHRHGHYVGLLSMTLLEYILSSLS